MAAVCQSLTTTRPDGPVAFINESIEARRLLGQTDELASARRWAEAARAYDRLIAEHGRELLRAEGPRFVNVTDQVNDRLVQWPAAAVAIYRELFGEQAARELGALGDAPVVSSLLAIADRWWLTPAGGQAADQAARRLLERGRLDAAGHLFDRLGRFHPDFRTRADAAVRAAFAFTSAGHGDRAADATCRARAIGGDVQWFGESIPVETALARIEQTVARPVPEDPNQPMPGDGASRSRPAPPVEPPVELVWRCDLQSAPGDAPALSPPVVRNDHVYVQSASRVWSLRLNSGRIEWAYSSVDNGAVCGHPDGRDSTGACFAPTVSNWCVFAVLADRELHPLGPGPPRQGALLVCLDARNGALRWRVSAAILAGSAVAQAAADCVFDSSPLVHEGSLYVVLRQRMAPTLEVRGLACLDPRTGQPEWQTHLAGATPAADTDGPSEISRLAASGDAVCVRTEARVLACVQADTGRVRWLTVGDATADLATLGLTGAMSHRVAVDHLLVLAAEGRVSALAPQGSILSRLEKSIAERPDDPLAQLDLASYALSRPDSVDRGLRAIDALLTSAPTARINQGIARRVFEVVLDAAATLTASGTTSAAETKPGIIDKLLQRAEATADTPDEHIRYRFVFADQYRRLARPNDAVGLCQQVLDNRDLRETRWLDQARSVRAGDEAERKIDTFMAEYGRECYERYDATARERFTTAQTCLDRDGLREALTQYPNAQAAPEAAVALAGLERQAGEPLSAVRRLRALLEDSRPQPADTSLDRPAVVRMIADGYFDAGQAAEGLAWLARGQRDYPDARFTADGASETFASLRHRRLAERRAYGCRLPGIDPPLARAFYMALDGPTILLQPPLAASAPGSSAPALVCHNGVLEAFDPRTGHPRWNGPPAFTSPPTWLGSADGLLLLATRYQVRALESATGVERWHLGTSPPGVAWPGVDPEIFTELLDHALDETRLVTVDEDGRASAVRVLDGQVLWERQLAQRFSGPLAMNDQYLVYVSTVDQATTLVILDALTGRDLRTIGLDGARQVQWLAMSPARTIVAAGADWAACYDPDTAARLWQRQDQRFAGVQMGLAELCCSPAPGEIAVLSLDSGDDLWRRPVVVDGGEAILRTWSDRGDVYVVSTRAACAFELPGGRRRWRTELPTGAVVDASMLAERFVVVLTSRKPDDAQGSAGRQVELYCIDLQTGQPSPAGCVDLKPAGRVRDAVLLDRALWLHDDAGLAGWTTTPDRSVHDP